MKKNDRNTKGRIISAAWKLFYDQGFEETTIEDIVRESETSKGSFYHYFESKDALIGSLAYIFDEKYEELEERMDDSMNSLEKLKFLNHEMFLMIDETISLDLLARLLSTQILKRGEKQLLDRSRVYFKLLKKVITDGQARHEITDSLHAETILKDYAMQERALMYDWCLNNGEYNLTELGDRIMSEFINNYKYQSN
ncbi:MAG: helix-turn-helix domain-containing protein [Eubacteriales bacterium]|nr:helix-turn-helix domain-containing protein [Eubacteriales bacterium]